MNALQVPRIEARRVVATQDLERCQFFECSPIRYLDDSVIQNQSGISLDLSGKEIQELGVRRESDTGNWAYLCIVLILVAHCRYAGFRQQLHESVKMV